MQFQSVAWTSDDSVPITAHITVPHREPPPLLVHATAPATEALSGTTDDAVSEVAGQSSPLADAAVPTGTPSAAHPTTAPRAMSPLSTSTAVSTTKTTEKSDRKLAHPTLDEALARHGAHFGAANRMAATAASRAARPSTPQKLQLNRRLRGGVRWPRSYLTQH